MDYNAPSFSTDPDADYVGKSGGTLGSPIPPNVPTLTQREIVNAEKVAGLAPANTDRTQLAQGIGRGIWVGALGANPNALVGAIGGGANGTKPGILQVLNPWTRLRGIALQTNTQAAVPVTVSGIGSAGGFVSGALLRRDGSPLQPGDVPTLVPFEFQPDAATPPNFRMVGLVASDLADAASKQGRLRLSANLTLYVNATTGSDATGTGAQANPFATPAAAYTYALTKLDLAGYVLTVSCQGAFTKGVAVNGLIPGQIAAGSIVFDGNGSATITAAESCFYAGAGAAITVKNFGPLSSTATGLSNGCGLYATNGATIIFDNLTFAACASFHLYALNGGTIYTSNISGTGGSSYKVSGSAVAHFFAAQAGRIQVAGTAVTITAACSFSTAFAWCLGGGLYVNGMTFANPGNVSGQRYYLDGFGYVLTGGGGANFFPGTSPGAIDGNGAHGEYL